MCGAPGRGLSSEKGGRETSLKTEAGVGKAHKGVGTVKFPGWR